MKQLMRKQQAADRVNAKHAKLLVKKMERKELRGKQYLPSIKFNPTDSSATKTAKIATTLINSLHSSKKRLRHSCLKQSRSATIIRAAEGDSASDQNTATVGKEFKAKVLRYELKWVALAELQALLYRKSTRNHSFIELMQKDTFNNGMISRKDFNLIMVESLGDHNLHSHNRLYSCFDPDHKDQVFIGNIAVALEAVGFNGDAKKMMQSIFPVLVEAARADGDDIIDDDDNASNVISFEKIVTSFLTLSLSESDDVDICNAFRNAWERAGYGTAPGLNELRIGRREQSITGGGRYKSVTAEDFQNILDSNPQLHECIASVCSKIHASVKSSSNQEETFGFAERERNNSISTIKPRRKTTRKGSVAQ